MRRVNLIPLAGAGQRFSDAGYNIPKPLIDVEGLPMVVRAAKCLPAADHWIFICREEHIQDYKIDKVLKKHFSDSEIISVGHLTEGQAITCLLAKGSLKLDDLLTIGACDNSMEYDLEYYEKHITNVDAMIWTFRNNITVLENPQMYGWVKVNSSGKVESVSCKKPISDDPIHDHAVIGAFSFRRVETFLRGVESMIAKNRRINNEFYLDVAFDECIQLGFITHPMEVSKYVCWGTPEDLINYYNR